MERLEVDDPDKVAFITQTTLSVDETTGIIRRLREKFPNMVGPRTDDICYATQNRQDAVKQLAPRCDLVLVIGSRNSSNSNRLVEVARQHGAARPDRQRARGARGVAGGRRDRRHHLRRERARGAGAAADRLLPRARGARTSSELEVTEEDVRFMLPKDIRELLTARELTCRSLRWRVMRAAAARRAGLLPERTPTQPSGSRACRSCRLHRFVRAVRPSGSAGLGPDAAFTLAPAFCRGASAVTCVTAAGSSESGGPIQAFPCRRHRSGCLPGDRARSLRSGGEERKIGEPVVASRPRQRTTSMLPSLFFSMVRRQPGGSLNENGSTPLGICSETSTVLCRVRSAPGSRSAQHPRVPRAWRHLHMGLGGA